MKKLLKIFINGILVENPVLILMIGLCSALAITTSVSNAIGMGIALTFVLVFSELIISLLKKLIPNEVRIPIFIVVIATFTTIIDLVMKAYFPALTKALGVFIPLIVVNCIIMGRVEAFASRKNVLESIFDGFGMGVGYSLVLITMAIVRELLGNGTLLGIQIMPDIYKPALVMILPPSGFFLASLWIAFVKGINKKL